MVAFRHPWLDRILFLSAQGDEKIIRPTYLSSIYAFTQVDTSREKGKYHSAISASANRN
jgi:hypothetical protein